MEKTGKYLLKNLLKQKYFYQTEYFAKINVTKSQIERNYFFCF